VASVSVLRPHRDPPGDACVPVVGVRTVTDRRTSGAPLVDQSLDGVQTERTFESKLTGIHRGGAQRVA